jgi:Homing endonuclease associated repeat
MSAVQLIGIGFAALSEFEQEAAFAELAEFRLRRMASRATRAESIVSSLAQAALLAGGEPTVADYKAARLHLAHQGLELVPVSQVIRHYGSWEAAKEALRLSGASTAGAIDARFRRRRLGKIWRYTEATLGETLARCVADYGHVPQVAEFDWWRQRELDLARRRGDDASHLPSATPYRRRYGTWEAALLHFGYTPDQVAERLERG